MRTALVLLAIVLAGCMQTAATTEESLVSFPAAPLDVDAATVVDELRVFSAAHPLRVGNSADHEAARVDLLARFADLGLTTWRHDFTPDGDGQLPQANIVGLQWGTTHPDEWVVVGGHYDVVPTPSCPAALPVCPEQVNTQGTYDDGSGTMLTVGLAAAYSKVETPFTIAYVAFDGEERGLQGSRAFAEMLVSGTPYGNVTVRAMLDLDMFGLNWPGVDSPIYFDDNSPELKAYVKDVAAAIGIPDGLILYQGISLGRSDYDSFFQIGAPTGFFISDFERFQAPADVPVQAPQESGQAYPFWHRYDTYDSMVLMAGSEADVVAGFQTAADLASAVLWRMAVSEEPLSSIDV
ncbi:MAG: M28 family peptidase [Candidatus Thermoplasmatota archaeon]